jgi:prevent-host-death family protein
MKKTKSAKDETQERTLRVEEPAADLALPSLPKVSSLRSPLSEEGESLPGRTTVNVRTAKDQLSSLLERASEGEEIVITSDGRPKGMIVRFRPQAEGRVAQSMAELRRAMSQTDDSTALIRAERDAGF